jgi:hypothetical protein
MKQSKSPEKLRQKTPRDTHWQCRFKFELTIWRDALTISELLICFNKKT